MQLSRRVPPTSTLTSVPLVQSQSPRSPGCVDFQFLLEQAIRSFLPYDLHRDDSGHCRGMGRNGDDGDCGPSRAPDATEPLRSEHCQH